MKTLKQFVKTKYQRIIGTGFIIIAIITLFTTNIFKKYPIGPEYAAAQDQTLELSKTYEITWTYISQRTQTYSIGNIIFQFILQSTPHIALTDNSGNILTVQNTFFAGIKASEDNGKTRSNFFTIKSKRDKITGQPIFYNPLAVFKSNNTIFVDIGDEQRINSWEGNAIRFFYDINKKEWIQKSCFTYTKTSRPVLNKGIYLPYLLTDNTGCEY